jgi:hypothetical protein
MSVQSSNQGFIKDKAHYVSQFLEKTLGVSQILNQFPEATQVAKSETDLGFFIEDYINYNAPESELLLKMIAAMKIESHRYKIFDLNEAVSETQKTKYTIYFVDTPQSVEQTYSPRALLKNPNYKKVTWDFLKNVMSEISKTES